MLYLPHENQGRKWNDDTPHGGGGAYGKCSGRTTSVRSKKLGNSIARPGEGIRNGLCKCQQAQDSLQDAGKRCDVLLDARPTVGLGRHPPFRLWKIGTRRILAVLNGPSHYPSRTVDDLENPEFPTELDRAYEADNRRHKKTTGIMWAIPPPVFADFEICPLEPEHKGWMQCACIESVKNIFI